FKQVNYSSWCPNNNINSIIELSYLLANWSSTIYTDRFHIGRIRKFPLNLFREFSCWGQNNSQGKFTRAILFIVPNNCVQYGDSKSQSLSCTCFGTTNHVLSLHCWFKDSSLDWEQLGYAARGELADDLGRDPELGHLQPLLRAARSNSTRLRPPLILLVEQPLIRRVLR
ncbi:hypothetical protein EE612_060878, partial [Oryza sativa]